MSLLRRLAERRDLHSSYFAPDRIPLNSEGYATPAGVAVTPKSALCVSAVYACVRLLSTTVASLPVDVYRKTGSVRLPLDLPMWLERPNPDFNRFEFLEQVMASLLLWGNAYLVKVTEDSTLLELWVLNPEHVSIRTEGTRRVYKVSRGGQVVGEFSPDEIVHIRAFSAPGSLLGLSPIDLAKATIGLASAAEEYGGRFFANSASPGGVIEYPGDVTDVELKRTARAWKASHQGARRAHELGFLTGGATFKAITIPNDAAQFIESRQFTVTDIARWFGVQPHKIGDLGRATWGNIEHQAIEWVIDGVRPWLVRLEQALNPLLGRGRLPDLRTTAFLTFRVEGLLRGDSAARAAFYTALRNLGAMNADEIRGLEDLEPIPGGRGRDFWQPANMLIVGQPMPAANGTEPDAALARLLAAARR